MDLYKIPRIILVGYGRSQTYQIKCLYCGKQFFPGKEIEFFCEECLITVSYDRLNRKIKEDYYSPVECVGEVIGWENRVTTNKKRSRYNYMKVYNRDKYICQYCGYNPRTSKLFQPLHVDHIVPHSYGGSNRMDNLVVSCGICNHIASNKMFSNFDKKRVFILQRRMDKGHYVSNFLQRAYELKEYQMEYMVTS